MNNLVHYPWSIIRQWKRKSSVFVQYVDSSHRQNVDEVDNQAKVTYGKRNQKSGYLWNGRWEGAIWRGGNVLDLDLCAGWHMNWLCKNSLSCTLFTCMLHLGGVYFMYVTMCIVYVCYSSKKVCNKEGKRSKGNTDMHQFVNGVEPDCPWTHLFTNPKGPSLTSPVPGSRARIHFFLVLSFLPEFVGRNFISRDASI